MEELTKLVVETSQDLVLFLMDFSLESLEFSDFKEFLSTLRFFTVVKWFSHFCYSLNNFLSCSFIDLFCCCLVYSFNDKIFRRIMH